MSNSSRDSSPVPEEDQQVPFVENPQEFEPPAKGRPDSKKGPKQFPSMLFESSPVIEINNKLRKKYLVFRVYEDPI